MEIAANNEDRSWWWCLEKKATDPVHLLTFYSHFATRWNHWNLPRRKRRWDGSKRRCVYVDKVSSSSGMGFLKWAAIFPACFWLIYTEYDPSHVLRSQHFHTCFAYLIPAASMLFFRVKNYEFFFIFISFSRCGLLFNFWLLDGHFMHRDRRRSSHQIRRRRAISWISKPI